MPKIVNVQGPDENARYWRLPAVITYTGRSRTAIYRDPTFPRPIKIAPNTAAWIAAEIIRWCESREAEAGRAAA